MKKKLSILLIIILIGILFINVYFYYNKTTVAIIGAMDCEISEIYNNLKNTNINTNNNFNISKGKINNYNIILSKSGVGKTNAGITTQYIIDKYKPKYIINIGLAGGLDEKIKKGDIVIADKLIQHDFDISVFGYAKGYMSTGTEPNKPTIYYSNEDLINIFKEKLKKNNEFKNIYIETIATGDCFVSNKKDKENIKKIFNAKAVDMESAAIAQTANKNNIPVLIIRNISDSLDSKVKDYEHDEEFYAKELAKTIVNILQEKN